MAGTPNAYSKLADERLMVLVAEKDSRAFEALYDRYSRLMYNYFHRMLWKDREKARDFTQDLFSRLIHKPHLYDPARPFKTWLYSIAHNMCKNEYAKQEVRRDVHEELRYDSSAGHGNDAQMSMDRSAFREKLQEALSGLDATKRTTFELRFFQEMSIQEISEVMQCSEGTVKSRIFYTLKELNQQLRMFEGILGALLITILQQIS